MEETTAQFSSLSSGNVEVSTAGVVSLVQGSKLLIDRASAWPNNVAIVNGPASPRAAFTVHFKVLSNSEYMNFSLVCALPSVAPGAYVQMTKRDRPFTLSLFHLFGDGDIHHIGDGIDEDAKYGPGDVISIRVRSVSNSIAGLPNVDVGDDIYRQGVYGSYVCHDDPPAECVPCITCEPGSALLVTLYKNYRPIRKPLVACHDPPSHSWIAVNLMAPDDKVQIIEPERDLEPHVFAKSQ